MSSPSGLSPEVVSVLVADSNQTQSQLLCGALRRQGAFKVASCQSELSECLSILEADPADVLLLADGITDHRERLYELLRGVHSGYPNLAIVLLLDNYDRELVVNSLRAGARGLFCLASMPFKSLCRCITSVHQGQYWTNTEQMRYVIDALSIAPSIHLINSRGLVVLTPREEQTVHLVSLAVLLVGFLPTVALANTGQLTWNPCTLYYGTIVVGQTENRRCRIARSPPSPRPLPAP